MERKLFLQSLATLSLVGIAPKISKANLLNKSNAIPFHFVGLGTVGSKLITEFHHSGYKGLFTTIDNKVTIKNDQLINRIDLNNPTEIINTFSANNKFIIIAALGGKTGTELTHQIYSLLNGNQKQFKMIVSVPASFDGHSKNKRARDFINDFGKDKRVYSFDVNDFRSIYGNMTIREVFDKSDETFHSIYTSKISDFDMFNL